MPNHSSSQPASPAASRDAIVQGSIAVASSHGLNGWTVERVARATPCAKGLVIYHFKSRELLLDATIQALEEERAASLAAAVRSATGPAVLDAIWTALVAEVSSGRFGAWLALRARTPFGNRTPAASAGRPGSSPGLRRPLAAALGAPLDALPSDVTISAALEGAAVAIVAGTPEPDVREAYDRLWLGMLSV